MTDTRKEFEEWFKSLGFTDAEQQAGRMAWQACQSLNDKRISELEAKIKALKKELGEYPFHETAYLTLLEK